MPACTYDVSMWDRGALRWERAAESGWWLVQERARNSRQSGQIRSQRTWISVIFCAAFAFDLGPSFSCYSEQLNC